MGNILQEFKGSQGNGRCRSLCWGNWWWNEVEKSSGWASSVYMRGKNKQTKEREQGETKKMKISEPEHESREQGWGLQEKGNPDSPCTPPASFPCKPSPAAWGWQVFLSASLRECCVKKTRLEIQKPYSWRWHWPFPLGWASVSPKLLSPHP